MEENIKPKKLFSLSPAVEGGRDKECSLSQFKKNSLFSLGYLGNVASVTHSFSNTQYSLKVLLKQKLKNQEKKINEYLKKMHQVKHSLLFRLLNHFEDNENLYLIFPCIRKDHSYLLMEINEKRLTKYSITKYFHEILNAVQFLHSFNLYYNSLEPEHILIRKEHIALTDYGWNKISLKNWHKRNSLLRNNYWSVNAYTPPEVFDENKMTIDRSKATKKSDIWQLGVLLYEMITRVQPFGFESEQNDLSSKEELKKIVNHFNKMKIDYSIIPKEYIEFKDLIEQMLEKNPENRIDIDDILNKPIFKQKLIQFPELKENEDIINPKLKSDYDSDIKALKKEIANLKGSKEVQKSEFTMDIQSLDEEKRTLKLKLKELTFTLESRLKEKDDEIEKCITNKPQFKSFDEMYEFYLPLLNDSYHQLNKNIEAIKSYHEENSDEVNKQLRESTEEWNKELIDYSIKIHKELDALKEFPVKLNKLKQNLKDNREQNEDISIDILIKHKEDNCKSDNM